MFKLLISAIVLTYNEEKNIKNCLNSIVDWADEIFIVDSGSTDKTLEIAKNYTNKIYHHPFENYARQRNWTQENLPIRNRWIFHLDADEEVSLELALELKMLFSRDISVDSFMIPRKTIFREKWIKHGFHYPVYHLRIFKKEKGKCEDRLYDQHFTVEGQTEKTTADIINTIEPDVRLLKAKHRKWAYQEARELLNNKRIKRRLNKDPIERRKWLRENLYYKMPLFIRPLMYFLYRYVLRFGFLDGKEGLLFHLIQGLYFRFLIDLEIYKLRKNG